MRRDGVCGPSNTHLSIFAGTGVAGAPTPGLATNSALYHPRGPAVDPTTGDVYIADYRNGEVERITPNGILSIAAGTGTFAPPTPGPATKCTGKSDRGRGGCDHRRPVHRRPL